MSQRINDNLFLVAEEPSSKCELCGAIEETRPYGPNYARICFDCGMKNQDETNRNMHRIMFGDEPSEEFLECMRKLNSTRIN